MHGNNSSKKENCTRNNVTLFEGKKFKIYIETKGQPLNNLRCVNNRLIVKIKYNQK